MSSEVEEQRRYYAETAARYDEMHLDADEEHNLALALMASFVEYLGIESVLDVGAGTGRTVSGVKRRCPGVRVVGVEPVQELREIGYQQGIPREELVEGDALRLAYGDGEFDLVCEFGALHHIPTPAVAVTEMLRVARRAIFISDCNNFGQGSFAGRTLKQILDRLGLWPLADWVKTRGRGFTVSEGDGVAYSYSVFNDYAQIASRCDRVHLFNTVGDGANLYRNASHVALIGVKSPGDR